MNNMMNAPPPNVSVILADTIRLENVSNDLIDSLKDLGAKESTINDEVVWIIDFGDDNDLATKLQALNKMGVLFVGEPSGWPPAAIFTDLRERKLLEGTFKEISWRGPRKWLVHEK
ncbi:MAG TPA: hypothetical protein VFR47_23875 [Anaerolineales bacterium]|nr:hypothetical protein [Anaerolineales bacterium]